MNRLLYAAVKQILAATSVANELFLIQKYSRCFLHLQSIIVLYNSEQLQTMEEEKVRYIGYFFLNSSSLIALRISLYEILANDRKLLSKIDDQIKRIDGSSETVIAPSSDPTEQMEYDRLADTGGDEDDQLIISCDLDPVDETAFGLLFN